MSFCERFEGLLCLGLLVTVTGPAYGQGSGGSPSANQELARLADAVNSVDAFTARYSVLIDGEVAGSVELAYLAPDSAFLRTIMEDASSSTWVIDGVLTVLNATTDMVIEWGQLDVRGLLATLGEALAPLYRDCTDLELPDVDAPKPVFHVHFHEGGPDVQWELSIETVLWRTFFCWYSDHGAQWGDVGLDDGHLVLYDGHEGTLSLSRENPVGFLVGAEASHKMGALELRLISLEYEVEASLLQIPRCPEGAQNPFVGSDHPRLLASGVHEQVAQLLEEGHITWGEDAKRCLEAVLEEIHLQWLPEQYSEWVLSERERLERVAQVLVQARDEGLNEEELRKAAASQRQEVEEVLRKSEEDCLDGFVVVVEGEWGEKLLSVEQEVIRSLFEETVSTPVLECFEAEFEEFL